MFNKDLSIVKTAAKYNVDILKSWIFVGLILRFMSGFLPSEGAFFIYLLSSIRFLGAFGLLTIDFKKYKLYIIMVFGFEILSSVREGMFHDMILWLIFLALLVSYLYKPKLYIKIIVILVGVSFLFLLQIAKSDYRSRTWQGNQDAGLETFKSSIESSTSKSEGFFDIETMASSVSRVNQAWIFASTVDNLQRTQEFQSFSLLGRYLEAALLPRFLAPNKLNAGSREIFNQFSGRFIDVGTSMALGLFADGYVSFGTAGVYLFALGFGLIFCFVFRIVDGWSKISPFFIFFLFPILHYAIRSDCETQTVLGHIVKGTFLFGLMVLYYKNYFSVQEKMLKKEKVTLVALSGKLST